MYVYVMCVCACVCVWEWELIMWNTRASLALKRGEPRAVHYWWVTHIADTVTNTNTHTHIHARMHTTSNVHTHTQTWILYLLGSDSSSSPGVCNSSCWHTSSTCYTLAFQHLSLWSIWDCPWPYMLHYLAGGVFDPTARTDLSSSLMLNLAGTRAHFHYFHTQTCMYTHRLCLLCKSL